MNEGQNLPTPNQGDRCEEHDEEWRMPWPRQPGERNVDYIGHVRLHQRADGGISVYWHPMDLWPGRRIKTT
jgi:hypothetical protein